MGEEGICSGWRVRKNRFDILSSNNKQQHFFIKILELGGLRVAWNEWGIIYRRNCFSDVYFLFLFLSVKKKGRGGGTWEGERDTVTGIGKEGASENKYWWYPLMLHFVIQDHRPPCNKTGVEGKWSEEGRGDMRIQGVLQNIRGNRYQRPIECGFSQSEGANYRKERRGVKKGRHFEGASKWV